MYDRIQLTDRCSYFAAVTNVGLISLGSGKTAAIDGGDGPAAAEALLSCLTESGERLTAIYNTHAHADHVGGDALLQRETGCAVFAPGAEAAIAAKPELNAALLYGGCPGPEQRHPFFFAEASSAAALRREDLPEGVEPILLPGHSPCMTAYRCDGVLYLGDALCSREELEKCPLTYVWDVGAYCESLKWVMDVQADWYVPSHAPAMQRVRELARFNLDCVNAVRERILSLCAEPIGFDDLLAALMRGYGLRAGPNRWLLASATLRSYLSFLINGSRLKTDYSDARLTYCRA